jgi:hypothetical protein
MSGEPMEQWSDAPTVNYGEQCASQKLEQQSQNAPDMSGVPPDCPV